MGILKRLIIIILCASLFCFTLGDIAYSQDIYIDKLEPGEEILIPIKEEKVEPDKPMILLEGEKAPFNGFLFSENQFIDLLKLKSNYKIDTKYWQIKEEIYQEALKKAEKQIGIPFFKSFKFGFICGVGLIILSAYAIGQVK